MLRRMRTDLQGKSCFAARSGAGKRLASVFLSIAKVLVPFKQV